MYSNLKHVTCLAHSLHRVCESLREEYQTANEFLTNMRKVLLKAPARIQIFKEVTESEFSIKVDMYKQYIHTFRFSLTP